MEGLILGQSVPHFMDQLCEHFYMVVRTDTQIMPGTRAKLEETGIFWLLKTIPLYVPASLPDVWVGDDPPTFEWFQSLPSVADFDFDVLRKYFIIYVACLEKDGAPGMIAIGSAADSTNGGRTRMTHWFVSGYHLPVKVVEAQENGYTITSVNVLTLMEVPPELRTPTTRCFVLDLETTNTFVFWSVYQGVGLTAVAAQDKYMAHMCPWDVTQLNYGGLNTHSPMSELVRKLELTPEQFEEIAVKSKEKKRERDRRYKEKKNDQVKVGRSLLELQKGDATLILDTDDEDAIEAAKDHDAEVKKRNEKYREPQKERYNAIMDVVKAQQNGELSELDTEDEKAIKNSEVYFRGRAKMKVDRREATRLSKLEAAGQLEDPTQEQERLLDIARKRKADSDNQQERKKAKRVLMVRYENGEVSNPTPGQMADIKWAQDERDKTVKANKERHVRDQARRELMRRYEDGRLPSPTEAQMNDIKWAQNNRAKASASSKRRWAAKKEAGADDMDVDTDEE